MYAILITAALFQFDIFADAPSAQVAVSFDIFADAPVEIAKAEQLPLLTIYAPSWCSGCNPKVQEIKSMVGFSFDVRERSSEFPGWTQSVGGTYPIIEWEGHDKPYYVNNYTTTDDLRKRWEKTQKPTVKAVVVQATRRAGLYYSRAWGGNWTWPGELRSHLVNVHGLSWSTVNSWSDSQCVGWHNRRHEGRASNEQRSGGFLARLFCPTCP